MPLSEVMTVNQATQVGVETVAGTAPAGGANKYLADTMIHLDPNITGNAYAASGHRADGVWVPNYDYSDLTVDGPMTYDEMSYLLAAHYGAPTITTPAGALLGRKHAYAPPLTGIITPQSLYVQQGDSVRAASATYGVLADWGFTATRKECKLSSCKGFGQQFTDGIAMTASPTKIGQNPILPVAWNVYLDTTAATIGTTQLDRCYQVEFKSTGAHAPNWPGGRQFASFGTIVNEKPKMSLALALMADSVAGGQYANSRAGTKVYIRYEAIGPLLDNLQTVTIGGGPTGGTFTLTYKGQTTAGIAFNATSGAVATALGNLTTVGTNNVSVTGGTGGPYTVSFIGALAQDSTLMTASGTGLTPSGTVTIAQVQNNWTFVLDTVAVPEPKARKDDAGAWTIGLDFNIVEDANWTEATATGTFLYAYLINSLTAL